MVEEADAAIIIHDGESKGTQHTYNLATQKGIPVYYVTVKKTQLFNPQNIDILMAEAQKNPFVSSSMYIAALQYIKDKCIVV